MLPDLCLFNVYSDEFASYNRMNFTALQIFRPNPHCTLRELNGVCRIFMWGFCLFFDSSAYLNLLTLYLLILEVWFAWMLRVFLILGRHCVFWENILEAWVIVNNMTIFSIWKHRYHISPCLPRSLHFYCRKLKQVVQVLSLKL